MTPTQFPAKVTPPLSPPQPSAPTLAFQGARRGHDPRPHRSTTDPAAAPERSSRRRDLR
ncbi:MAG: hypothetical protein AB7O66_12970 [Limisphaerales bacterium]